MTRRAASKPFMPGKTARLVHSRLAVSGVTDLSERFTDTGCGRGITNGAWLSARAVSSGATEPQESRYVIHKGGIFQTNKQVLCRVIQGGALRAKGKRRMWRPKSVGSSMPPNRFGHDDRHLVAPAPRPGRQTRAER